MTTLGALAVALLIGLALVGIKYLADSYIDKK